MNFQRGNIFLPEYGNSLNVYKCPIMLEKVVAIVGKPNLVAIGLSAWERIGSTQTHLSNLN